MGRRRQFEGTNQQPHQTGRKAKGNTMGYPGGTTNIFRKLEALVATGH